jgi:hypothetical protein
MREAEAREAAKRQQKEIAKRKLDPNYKPDTTMQGISSMDIAGGDSQADSNASTDLSSKSNFKD